MNRILTLTVIAGSLFSSAMLAAAPGGPPADAVRVTNGAGNPVPVTGAVTVSSMPPVTGTVGISGTASVNVASMPPVMIANVPSVSVASLPPVTIANMPPVNVTTGHDPQYFVVPYAVNVTTSDHIGVTLARPAILDAVATTCDGSLVGTHFQVTTDFMVSSATAFDSAPQGTQLVVRDALTGVYTPTPQSLNYPPYEYQHLLDFPSLATSEFHINQLDLLVLSDVNFIGPAFNSSITYCWGYFLFRKL